MSKAVSQEEVSYEQILITMKEQFKKAQENYDKLTENPHKYKECLACIIEYADHLQNDKSLNNYELAKNLGASLYEFTHAITGFNSATFKIIKAHLDALYIVFEENITGVGDNNAQELLRELQYFSR